MDLLEVIVTSHSNGYWQEDQSWVNLPNEKLFHEIITDQEVVQHAHEMLSSLETMLGLSVMHRPVYIYWLRFATDGRTTLLYWGEDNRVCWRRSDTVDTRSVNGPGGYPVAPLLRVLHDCFGVPVWAEEDLRGPRKESQP
jgi:hypothetical protein